MPMSFVALRTCKLSYWKTTDSSARLESFLLSIDIVHLSYTLNPTQRWCIMHVLFRFKSCALLTFLIMRVTLSNEKLKLLLQAAPNKTHFLIITIKQLLRQCSCRKLTKKSLLLAQHIQFISILHIERDSRFFFPPEDCGCCCVCPSGSFGTRPSSPKVKHITQMCHNLGWAWMLLKDSTRPQKESGASFDEEMAFLPFLPARPCHGGVAGGLSMEMSLKRRIMISLLSVKSQSRFGSGWKKETSTKKGWNI